MTRKFTALAVAASVALATLVTSAPAHAGNGKGAAFAVGLIGGAILGGALAQAQGRERSRPTVDEDGYDAPRYVERRVVERRFVASYEAPVCKKITIEDEDGNVTVRKRCR